MLSYHINYDTRTILYTLLWCVLSKSWSDLISLYTDVWSMTFCDWCISCIHCIHWCFFLSLWQRCFGQCGAWSRARRPEPIRCAWLETAHLLSFQVFVFASAYVCMLQLLWLLCQLCVGMRYQSLSFIILYKVYDGFVSSLAGHWRGPKRATERAAELWEWASCKAHWRQVDRTILHDFVARFDLSSIILMRRLALALPQTLVLVFNRFRSQGTCPKTRCCLLIQSSLQHFSTWQAATKEPRGSKSPVVQRAPSLAITCYYYLLL